MAQPQQALWRVLINTRTAGSLGLFFPTHYMVSAGTRGDAIAEALAMAAEIGQEPGHIISVEQRTQEPVQS